MINHVMYVLLLGVSLLLGGVLIGKYMARLFAGNTGKLLSWAIPFEKLLYRLANIDAAQEMNWQTYTWALLAFNGIGALFLFLLQLAQGVLPLNPVHLPSVRWDTAFNTAVSFMTNTNWQAYSGELTMSYLTQMLGLTAQNFLSAATGIAALLALTRGFVRKTTDLLGNFWVDLTRATLYVFLPFSIIFAALLMSQGVVQTWQPPIAAETLEGAPQTIAVGPAASQIAIKQLGSNGGGFFNANSAHPFENPNLFTNFLELFAILWLPLGCVFLFGEMLNNQRQGRAMFVVMLALFLIGLSVALFAEYQGNPLFERAGIAQGVNLEGKEIRFGRFHSILWGVATTATSNGSVNSMHDSLLPLSGMIYLFYMGIGEVVFGGVGVGVIGMIFYIILTMFIAGLMIGRTPEFLGKKLGPFEMAMSLIALLLPMLVLLIIAGIAIVTPTGLSSLNNTGSHGVSEILYAASSACGNNGSAFAGLNANTPFYNLLLGLGMLVGRFATIVPALALAGALAKKKIAPTTHATFPTTGALFVIMVIAVALIMGALTFFPFYALGPLLEHLMLSR